MKTFAHLGKRTASALGAVLSVAMICLPVYAQNPNIGTSGGQFLKIPVGARAAAMGGAYVANANDASALFWNPAGIVGVASSEFFVSHTPLWATVKLSNAAFVQSTEGLGSFGVFLGVLTMDRMEVTTEDQPEGTGQFFDARDLMIGVSFARKLTEDFAVGVNAKYISQSIWNESANGFAFDVGTQYRIGFRDLTIAMSMSNFGSDMRYEGQDLAVKYDSDTQNPDNRLSPARLGADDYPLPLHFQVGLAMTAISMDDFSLLLAVDATHPNDNKERVNVGAEATVLSYLRVRGGYRFGYDTERATFGAGVNVPLGATHVAFDYAYATFNLLPNLSRFSMSVQF